MHGQKNIKLLQVVADYLVQIPSKRPPKPVRT